MVTQSWSGAQVDVKVETGVFEETEAPLPLFGPVAQFHQVAETVGRADRRRWQQNVLSAHVEPGVVLIKRPLVSKFDLISPQIIQNKLIKFKLSDCFTCVADLEAWFIAFCQTSTSSSVSAANQWRTLPPLLSTRPCVRSWNDERVTA